MATTTTKETETEHQKQKAVQSNIYKIKIQRIKLIKTKVLQA